MAFIYKIINDINDKVYVGYTYRDLSLRFAEHCCSARGGSKCPLHAAIRKYGEEHFRIELIEKTDFPQERERYWIKIFDTYRSGYNATLGGDGTVKVDYDAATDVYAASGDPMDVAVELGISYMHATRILKSRDKEVSSTASLRFRYGNTISMYSLDGEFIRDFDSAGEAAAFAAPNVPPRTSRRSIGRACKGEQKTAYKYKWAYKNVADQHCVNHRRAIRACDFDGNLVKEFKSLTEAVGYLKANGYPRASFGTISSAAHNMQPSAYGFKWSYSEPVNIDAPPTQRPTRKVLMCALDGGVLQTFDSADSAADFLVATGCSANPYVVSQGIRQVCRGYRKSARGYIWKYVDTAVN